MKKFLALGVFALLCTSPIAAQDVYRLSDQITPPKPVLTPGARYPPSAMSKRIEGVVELELDVMPDGTVGTVAMVKSLDAELDKSAVDTARQYRFTPGTKDGKPVAVRTVVQIHFTLR
jgi:protein TonB